MSDAPLPSSFDGDSDFYDENRIRKFFRRFKDEPLVPVGVGLTCWAFWNASKSIRTGNSVRTNRFFRYRLYAQGFTIVAMIGGSIYYKADRLKRGEYVKLKEQQKAQEKREKWIKELEARDAEDKEWREKLGRVQDLQREEMQKMSDDRREMIKGVREENNTAKAGLAEAADKRAKTDDTTRYETVLGEREEGGFMGYKYIQGFYEHKVKPMVDDLTGKGTGESGDPPGDVKATESTKETK